METDPRGVQALLPQFVTRYWGQSAGASATSAHDGQEALAEARGALELAGSRVGAHAAVRAFTPVRHEHGYETYGSALETNTADLPFLVDSVAAEIGARGIGVVRVVHPIIGIVRDDRGAIVSIAGPREAPTESVMHFELDRRLAPEELAELEDGVRSVLASVAAVVRDFEPMREAVVRLEQLVREAGERGEAVEDDPAEVVEFLEWLRGGNMILLGYRDEVEEDGGLAAVADSALGLLGPQSAGGLGLDAELQIGVDHRDERLVRILRSHHLSPVHRREPMLTVLVHRTAADGAPAGAERLVGILTSRAAAEPASRTPQLRRKLSSVVDALELVEGSHDHKSAVALFDNFPKTELLASPTDDLRRTLSALLSVQPGDVRLVGRIARHGRAASLTASLPRERMTPELGQRLRAIVADAYRTGFVELQEVLGEDGRVLLHMVVRAPHDLPDVDISRLEERLRVESRTWSDRTREVLVERHGDERGRMLASRWLRRLPESYQAVTDPQVAAGDVLCFEQLHDSDARLRVGLQDGPLAGSGASTRVSLYKRGEKVELSEATPLLESHGLRVIEEQASPLDDGADGCWIQAFTVVDSAGLPLDLEMVATELASSIEAVWDGRTESDMLNRLVLTAGLRWPQVQILRAYRRYRQRVGSRYTETFQHEVIAAHPRITAKLMALFERRFQVVQADGGPSEEQLREQIAADLDDVELLDHDRILRNQLGLIDATVRTNVYRPGRGAMSFKLRSADVPAMPRPAPLFEIFVYAADMEGIHLRGGAIARGGIRWSDRMDYRTEVFGLMRAQMTKNAVIVPTGAKGGFYLKRLPEDPTKWFDAVKAAYVRYIEALLDVTDNLNDQGAVEHPDGVRVHDGEDAYFVVAADKGTATFSDTANEIAVRRGFWLGDAFASGGSVGYDHKKLGITARGAWESVKRHFLRLGANPERDAVTVVGIGDMSGDVFGNGMLLSRSMRLIAAYDHRHVFVDPDPADPERSWQERRRLFELSGSSWDDYDRALISEGGGVFPRTAKRVELTPQIRAALGVEADGLSPAELIQAVLRAPVDLLWNGGIGTVVKASHESDADAADRASDLIRVDAADLRCRVVGEGGNLGFTHRARIEAARAGILINADFIDNSAGVDSSDHEVNLKILLDIAVRRGLLSKPDRDALLAEVTDDVVGHVLRDSFLQAQALSVEVAISARRTYRYEDLMEELESDGILRREDEALPAADEISDRRRVGDGLLLPELAVLLAYSKRLLTERLLASWLPDDPAVAGEATGYFPPTVIERCGDLVAGHPLRRELIATLVAGDVVNTMGSTFVTGLVLELGADEAEVVRAYRIASAVSGAHDVRRQIEQLGPEIPERAVRELFSGVYELVASLTRWQLLHAPGASISPAIEQGRPVFDELAERMWDLRSDAWRERAERIAGQLIEAGVPEQMARAHAARPALYHASDIASVDGGRHGVGPVARAFFAVGERLDLELLEQQALSLPATTRVQRWAQQALIDELLDVRRAIAACAIEEGAGADADDAVDAFLARHEAVLKRLRVVARAIGADGGVDQSALMLAVGRLRELAGAGG